MKKLYVVKKQPSLKDTLLSKSTYVFAQTEEEAILKVREKWQEFDVDLKVKEMKDATIIASVNDLIKWCNEFDGFEN